METCGTPPSSTVVTGSGYAFIFFQNRLDVQLMIEESGVEMKKINPGYNAYVSLLKRFLQRILHGAIAIQFHFLACGNLSDL